MIIIKDIECNQNSTRDYELCKSVNAASVGVDALAFILIVFLIIRFVNKNKSFLINSTKIYSLQTKQRIKGSFWLGCGSINQTEKYFYYVKGDRGLILNNINAYDVELIESSKKQPCLEEWQIKNKTQFFMYVPKGTLYNKFDSRID